MEIRFPRSVIENLKEKEKLSTNDIVCGLILWACVTTSGKKKKEFRVSMPMSVNRADRLSATHMSESHFGNTCVYATLSVFAEDILELESTSASVLFCASKVRSAVRGMNSDVIQREIAWMQDKSNKNRLQVRN